MMEGVSARVNVGIVSCDALRSFLKLDHTLLKMGSMQIRKLERVLCQFLTAKGLQYISNFAWLKELKLNGVCVCVRVSVYLSLA